MTITRIYLPRKEVLALVGGRRQLEKLERGRELRRCYPAGLKQARYLAHDVKLILDRLGAGSS